MMRSRAVFITVIIFIALSVRLIGLGTFMTVDEENWMVRSSEFWHKLFHGDPGGTFLTTHPGATAMWLIGAGEMVQEYRTGITVDTSTLQNFRFVATLPIALATAFLIGLAAYFLFKIFPPSIAAVAAFLLAIEPYLTGLSQIAHLDALLALLMLNAVLAFLWYERSHTSKALLLSGISLGLAMGTKLLPALYAGLFLLCILTWQHLWTARKTWRQYVSSGAFLIGISLLTFYIIWPALWVKVDLNASFQQDVPTIAADEHVVLEEAGESVSPWTFYIKTVMSRVTPFVLIISGATILITFIRTIYYREASTTWWLFCYALGFLLMITLVAKRGDRYALPTLVILPILAAWGVYLFGQIIKDRWIILSKPLYYRLALAAGIVLISAQVLLWAPYAIAYNSPFFSGRSLTQQGWGEGLDEAARWLNTHPLADRLTIASWYPGVMGTYFKGKTMSLSSRDDDRVGFVILYRNMYGRGGDALASDILDEFRDKTPEHIVYIQGNPYVWIYNTIGLHYFIRNIGEITSGVEVGQSVTPHHNDWNSIEIGMSTFSGRKNTHDVVLQIRENPDSLENLRTVIVNAQTIQDRAWQKFMFDPIPNSAGKTYFVAVNSPTSVSGNAITVHFIDRNILAGEMYVRGTVRPEWDLAYRISE